MPIQHVQTVSWLVARDHMTSISNFDKRQSFRCSECPRCLSIDCPCLIRCSSVFSLSTPRECVCPSFVSKPIADVVVPVRLDSVNRSVSVPMNDSKFGRTLQRKSTLGDQHQEPQQYRLQSRPSNHLPKQNNVTTRMAHRCDRVGENLYKPSQDRRRDCKAAIFSKHRALSARLVRSNNLGPRRSCSKVADRVGIPCAHHTN